MKNWITLRPLAVLLLLIAMACTGYLFGYFLNVTTSPGSKYDMFGFPALPPLTKLNISSRTSNSMSAIIESGYADPSRILFVVQLNNETGTLPSNQALLTRENGEQIALSVLNPLPEETSKYLLIFYPTDWVNGELLDGQLSITFTSPTDSTQTSELLFDVELPIHPFKIFNPKKVVTVNGVDILLDRVLVAPGDTHTYICYPNRSDENWILTGEHITLNINRLVSNPNMPNPWIYDSTITEGEQLGEPGWSPPNKESRCIKLGFPIGDANPKFLTLTLPGLKNAMTTPIPDHELSLAYQKLQKQGIDMIYTDRQGIEYHNMPEGMTQKEAFHQFMDTLGYLREGPWVFRVLLTQ